MSKQITVRLSAEQAATVAEVLKHSGLTTLSALFSAPLKTPRAPAVFASEELVTNTLGHSCMTLLAYMEAHSIATVEELMDPDFTLRDGFKMRALARRYDAPCVRISTPAKFAEATGITEVNAYPIWLLKKHFGR